jgi:hypothetical protein
VQGSSKAQKEEVVSADLDKARDLIAGGKDKKALAALWRAEAFARTNEDEAQGLLELASAIRDRSVGRIRGDAELLVGYASGYLAHPAVSKLAVIADCRVVSCEGLGFSPDQALELVFTTEAAFVRSGKGDAEELARLEYAEITRIEFKELPPPRSAGRKAGTAALALPLGILLGDWSAAGRLTESHTVRVTVVTSRGRIVLLRKSPATPEDLQNRMAQSSRTNRQPQGARRPPKPPLTLEATRSIL